MTLLSTQVLIIGRTHGKNFVIKPRLTVVSKYGESQTIYAFLHTDESYGLEIPRYDKAKARYQLSFCHLNHDLL